jgi:hypothetical protein
MVFGHLESAAGGLGFVKAVLMAQRRKVPGATVADVNPAVEEAMAGAALRLPSAEGAELAEGAYIGVSSFGFSGMRNPAMRNPATAVRGLPGLRLAGARAMTVISKFLDTHPAVEEAVLKSIAEKELHVRIRDLQDVAKALADEFGTEDVGLGRKSSWRAGLVQAFITAAGDPETQLGGWLMDGAPTGVAEDVQAVGIFPKTDPTGDPYETIWRSGPRSSPWPTTPASRSTPSSSRRRSSGWPGEAS